MAYDPHSDRSRAPSNTEQPGVPEDGSGKRSAFTSIRERLQREGRLLPSGQVLWALVILGMVFDTALTGIGLSLGLQERNPIALAFIDSVGLVGAALVLKGAVIGIGVANWVLFPRLFPTQRHRRYLIPLGLALPWWVAVGLNTVLVLSVL